MNDSELLEKWFIHIADNKKVLEATLPKERKNFTLSPCDMTPDDVDYEMAKGKDKKILEICGMNQKSFEHFIKNYGSTYEYLYFFKCQLISDFSPLENLKNLQGVKIFWNIRSDKLWDMSKNQSLVYLNLKSCKKIAYNLNLLNTSKTLKYFQVSGDMDVAYPIKSLSCFANMPSLEKVTFNHIKIEDRDTSVIATLPALKEFNFPAGMLTTEEIAYMCAKYPNLKGESLGAYTTGDFCDVRICGYKKPSFNLPKGQARLDKYVAEFNALVEKFKAELND